MSKLINKTQGFTMVKNEITNSNLISFKAKGIYLYLVSKPDNWNFSSDRIAGSSTDGDKAVKSGLKELESVGLLKRTLSKKIDNRFNGYDYEIFDSFRTDLEEKEFTPVSLNWVSLKQVDPNQVNLKQADISNTIDSNTEISNTESNNMCEGEKKLEKENSNETPTQTEIFTSEDIIDYPGFLLNLDRLLSFDKYKHLKEVKEINKTASEIILLGFSKNNVNKLDKCLKYINIGLADELLKYHGYGLKNNTWNNNKNYPVRSIVENVL